jgi:hypothetical protein
MLINTAPLLWYLAGLSLLALANKIRWNSVEMELVVVVANLKVNTLGQDQGGFPYVHAFTQFNSCYKISRLTSVIATGSGKRVAR